MDMLTLPFRDPNPYHPTGSQLILLFLFSLILGVFAFSIGQSVILGDKNIVIFDTGISLYDYLRILSQIRVDEWGNFLVSDMGAGFREEFIHRFILFRILFMETLGLSFPVALTLSSVLFGIMHYGNLLVIGNKMMLKAISFQVWGATLMGFLLGYLYYYTNNILFVMLLHGIYDFITGLNMTVLDRYMAEQEKKKKSILTYLP